jgi:hypothetical protein
MANRGFSRALYLLAAVIAVIVMVIVGWSVQQRVRPVARVAASSPASASNERDSLLQPSEPRPHESTDVPAEQPSEGTLVGQVVDERNRPLEAATVTVFAPDVLRSLAEVQTDAAGRFRLAGLPFAQTFRVQTVLRGYRTSNLELRFAGSTTIIERTMTLGLGQTISGRVLDHTEAPIAGAVVGSSDSETGTTLTDASGSFVLSGLPNAPVNLFARAEGHAPRHLRGVSPGQTGVQFIVEPAATISGDVSLPSTVNEMLVSLCHIDVDFKKEVCVSRQLLRTGATRYRLEGLAAGAFELVAEAPGYPAQRHPVLLVAGEERVGPRVSFTRR